LILVNFQYEFALNEKDFIVNFNFFFQITHFTPAIEVFIRYKGVERFVYFLKRKDVKRETSVIKCVTKALSNCGMKPNTVKKLREMNLIDYLAPYVTGEDEEVVKAFLYDFLGS